MRDGFKSLTQLMSGFCLISGNHENLWPIAFKIKKSKA